VAKVTIKSAKKRVIKQFMAQYHGRPCEVCGSTYGTCAHHYVGKGYCPHHIVSPENIIVLCQRHHGPYGKAMNPHSGCPDLVRQFEEWVEVYRPDIILWAAEHKNDTVANCGKIDWITLAEEGAFK